MRILALCVYVHKTSKLAMCRYFTFGVWGHSLTFLYLLISCIVSAKNIVFMVPLFVLAASVVPAYVSQTEHLLCGVTENIPPDWMYQETDNAQRHKISVNGSLESDHNVRYSVEGSSLVINEVRASDAGIYLCGRGSQLYHKLQLNVSGMYLY